MKQNQHRVPFTPESMWEVLKLLSSNCRTATSTIEDRNVLRRGIVLLLDGLGVRNPDSYVTTEE